MIILPSVKVLQFVHIYSSCLTSPTPILPHQQSFVAPVALGPLKTNGRLNRYGDRPNVGPNLAQSVHIKSVSSRPLADLPPPSTGNLQVRVEKRVCLLSWLLKTVGFIAQTPVHLNIRLLFVCLSIIYLRLLRPYVLVRKTFTKWATLSAG